MLNIPNLLSALRAIGKGHVFVSDTIGGALRPLGATEGEIKVAFNQEFNDLKFPEYTGPAIHERRVTGENVTVTLPLILGDPELYRVLSPSETTNGGYTSQRAVETTTLAIFPESELRGGLAWNGVDTWTPAAPRGAVWIWRGHFVRPGYSFKQADGGKVIVEATFQAMFVRDEDHPEGHRLYTIGDPVAAGITLSPL